MGCLFDGRVQGEWKKSVNIFEYIVIRNIDEFGVLCIQLCVCMRGECISMGELSTKE